MTARTRTTVQQPGGGKVPHDFWYSHLLRAVRGEVRNGVEEGRLESNTHIPTLNTTLFAYFGIYSLYENLII